MAIFSRTIIGRFSQVEANTAISAEAYKEGMSACGTSPRYSTNEPAGSNRRMAD
jgi:hypothetical protein